MIAPVVAQLPLLLAVRDVLRAAGIRCEISRPPAPAQGAKAPPLPYVVLYSIDGGDFQVALDSPDSCSTQVVQATSVHEDGRKAAMVADAVRKTLLGRQDGAYVLSLDAEATEMAPAQRVRGRRSLGLGGHEPDSQLVSVPERYEFLVETA